MKTERGEAGTRISMTEADRRDYKGIARHPLARRWLFSRLIEAREKAAAAETEQALQRWSAEAHRAEGELRRCGVSVGKGQ